MRCVKESTSWRTCVAVLVLFPRKTMDTAPRRRRSNDPFGRFSMPQPHEKDTVVALGSLSGHESPQAHAQPQVPFVSPPFLFTFRSQNGIPSFCFLSNQGSKRVPRSKGKGCGHRRTVVGHLRNRTPFLLPSSDGGERGDPSDENRGEEKGRVERNLTTRKGKQIPPFLVPRMDT